MLPSSIDLKPNEIPLAQKIVQEIQQYGYSPTYQQIHKIDWKWEPVSPETFLLDNYYMGKFCRDGKLYDKWLEVLCEVLNPDKNIYELIITGAIGTGKSTMAALALAYRLYRLSCLKNPAVFYGLMEESAIVFGTYNIYKYKAGDNYGTLKTFIEACPYFRDCFPTAKMADKSASDGLKFGHRIKVIAGSSELHAIGNNLLGLLVDEMNFMKGAKNSKIDVEENRSQAHRLYDASRRRITSRFMYKGQIPGMMILISSRNTETSWLEKHIQTVGGRPGVYVADYPLWEVKKSVMGYSGKTFKVEVGDQFASSRILTERDIPREGARVINVPVEHKQEFRDDVDGALRDLAGVASVSHAPFIKYRDHIQSCITDKLQHPFTKPAFELSTKDGIQIKDYFNSRSVVEIRNSVCRPKLNPGSTRFAHIDLAETGDSAGICMGHISKLLGIHPHITYDFMLRIKAPRAGMIDFSKIREFFVYLRDDLGYPIRSITFDRFQSTDSRQILAKAGFDTSLLSVDRNDEPYIVARSMLYEHRMTMYDYPIFRTELINLIHDMVKKKVDHPEGGSKDVSDSWAAVAFKAAESIGKDKDLNKSADPRLMPRRVRDIGSGMNEHARMAREILR